MNETPAITIGPYEPGDEHAILECFSRVFGQPRTLAHWHWKFRDCPFGIHCYLGKTASGQVVSQFTGIPTPYKVGAEVFTFSQILDSMVDPAYRRGLKKPGLFASTVYDYVDRYGHGDEEAIMYGLPNPPAFRIGRRLLGYSFIHDVVTLYKSREALAARPLEAPAGVAVERVARFGPVADRLWEAFHPAVEVCLVKRAEYLDWRYADCPDQEYAMLVARDRDGTPRGLAVARGGFIGTGDAALCDWVVPPADEEARVALMAAVEAEARRAAAAGLHVLFPSYAPEWRAVEALGYAPRESRFIQVARSYTPRVPLELLKEKWFYTWGDYDLV